MRNLLLQIFAYLFLSVAGLSAQGTILVDQNRGCDSLTVVFTVTDVPDIGSSTAVVWDYGDGKRESGPLTMTHKYSQPKVYNVRCILNGVFDIYASQLVRVGATPYADFRYKVIDNGDADLNYSFEPQHFNPIEGISIDYFWTFSHQLETVTLTEKEPVYSIAKKDTCFVSLTLTDEVGCTGSVDSVMVIGSDSLIIPNIFTPNGDGVNDYFKVTTSGEENWEFKVYTREGLLIYSSLSPMIQWEGRTYGDAEAAEGVYYYTIMNESDNNEKYKGFLYIFRRVKNR